MRAFLSGQVRTGRLSQPQPAPVSAMAQFMRFSPNLVHELLFSMSNRALATSREVCELPVSPAPFHYSCNRRHKAPELTSRARIPL